jgi:hypothetical protein
LSFWRVTLISAGEFSGCRVNFCGGDHGDKAGEPGASAIALIVA